MEGIVLVNKPVGFTSRDVVNKLNHIFNTPRIGHTGTLDPLASGVLVCCVGKYTKLVNVLTCLDKEYVAEIKLGIKTDTGDITGNVIKEMSYKIEKNEILNVFSSFVGKSIQTVPIYSAVKVNGKKLYEYARENIEVELPRREIEVFSLELLDYNEDIIKFKTRVSKGTYIRALIEDICSKLNTVGTMSSLERSKQGKFLLDNCHTLKQIEDGKYNLLTIEDIFDYPVIEINEELYRKIKNGVILKNEYNIEDKVIFKYLDKCVAIYKLENNDLKSFVQL